LFCRSLCLTLDINLIHATLFIPTSLCNKGKRGTRREIAHTNPTLREWDHAVLFGSHMYHCGSSLNEAAPAA
jgi:hypothetical protein